MVDLNEAAAFRSGAANEVKMQDTPYLTQNEAAEVLRISPRSLERFRVEGTGPKFCRAGRRILYRQSDIQAWLESRCFTSTSEAAV